MKLQKDLEESSSTVALTASALAASFGVGFFTWRMTNANPWIGLSSTICFLFLVVIPLRLWWVMRMSADANNWERKLHGKGRTL
jgi:hypothetical protein